MPRTKHLNTQDWNMLKKTVDFFIRLTGYELSPRSWCKVVLLTTFLLISGAALLVFAVDPHYRYRLPFFYDTVYYQLYATAPRLLRDLNYDTLFIGSSMTRNFYLNDIDRTLGVKSIKLAAAGAATIDLKKFFDIAREAKGDALKKVVFSLDIYSLNKSEPHYKEFSYLYRDDFKEEYRYIFSRQTYGDMYYLLKRKLRPKKKRQHQADPNRMFSTEYPGMRFGIAEVVADARANVSSHHTQTPANPEVFERNLENELLPMVAENPKVQFLFYLAPYHIYTWCQSEQFKEAEGLLSQRTRVMKELLKYPNVKLYDYQADRTLVCNHSFYSDVQHFGSKAARLVLKKLASGEREIRNPAAADANEKELRTLIHEQMPVYYRDIQNKKEQKK